MEAKEDEQRQRPSGKVADDNLIANGIGHFQAGVLRGIDLQTQRAAQMDAGQSHQGPSLCKPPQARNDIPDRQGEEREYVQGLRKVDGNFRIHGHQRLWLIETAACRLNYW
jgi:hypothetical protein